MGGTHLCGAAGSGCHCPSNPPWAPQGHACEPEQTSGILGAKLPSLGLPPCEGGGDLLTMNQSRLLTAPRTPLLFLAATRWQMVFLSFHDYKRFFEKHVLETEDF